MDLQDRVAVVTGGTRGIGFGIAQVLAEDGATVVVSSRSEEKGKEAVDALDVGDRATFIACDVLDRDQVNALIDQTVERFGRLDVLVNNAGGSDGYALVHEMSDEAWSKAADWILNSAFWATKRAIPHMLENGWGRIINVSSVEAKQGNKSAISHYITFKHALSGFTKAVAHEYGTQGITSNAICPGAVETDLMKDNGPAAAASAGITYEEFLDQFAQHAMTKQLNTVDEVAAMARVLVGPHSAGITGSLLNVDGGTCSW